MDPVQAPETTKPTLYEFRESYDIKRYHICQHFRFPHLTNYIHLKKGQHFQNKAKY